MRGSSSSISRRHLPGLRSPVLRVAIATYLDGQWVNAVDQNLGGEKQFVLGLYVEGRYGLGTYGVDSDTNTAWAVLNYNADFAVSRDL